ncbi:MAG TPA: hypothetical protein VJT81_19345 [Burkholderiales bacterium]|nr:hypothetical protein [Burkholderiales bacterium]
MRKAIPGEAHKKKDPTVLRMGLLVDGAELSRLDAELIRKIRAAKVAEVMLVIQQELPERSLLERIMRALKRGRLLRTVAFHMAVWIERRLLAVRRPEINDLFTTIAIEEVCDAERLRVKPIVSPSGHVHRFANDDVTAIKSRNLDLLLRLGSGILRGDILNAASNGIISFHHGDNRTNRGGPPGYWEVFERRDFTGYIIQRLTEELDAGEVLMRGEVATRFTYLLNQHHLYKCSATTMVDLLARMGRERTSARKPGIEPINWYSNVLYTTPSIASSLRYFAAFSWSLCVKVMHAVLVRRGVWELRLLKGDWRKLVLSKAQRLQPPRGKLWADPFIVSRSHENVVFFEEFEFARGKGHIAALVGKGDGSFSYAGPVLKMPYHLSFPYVFQYQGDYYMCPETLGARAIQLWRCTSWPLKWTYHKSLLTDINAVDSMIFERDGRWWLFTNLDRDGSGDDPCRELHVYHSESPLSEIWTPLPSNPVVTGASQARNAGVLFRDGKIYRLAQTQAFDLYGRSIKLFEITALSEQGYSEKLVAELLPNHDLGSLGLHHLSACEDAVVFDAYRLRSFWTQLFSPRFSQWRFWSPKPHLSDRR